MNKKFMINDFDSELYREVKVISASEGKRMVDLADEAFRDLVGKYKNRDARIACKHYLDDKHGK